MRRQFCHATQVLPRLRQLPKIPTISAIAPPLRRELREHVTPRSRVRRSDGQTRHRRQQAPVLRLTHALHTSRCRGIKGSACAPGRTDSPLPPPSPPARAPPCSACFGWSPSSFARVESPQSRYLQHQRRQRVVVEEQHVALGEGVLGAAHEQLLSALEARLVQ